MKFRKKPLVVEARCLKSFEISTLGEMQYWVFHHGGNFTYEFSKEQTVEVTLKTSFGWLSINIGDWIVKDHNGHFYSCDPMTFAALYEEVDDSLLRTVGGDDVQRIVKP